MVIEKLFSLVKEKTAIAIDDAIKDELLAETNHEGQIVVHCYYTGSAFDDRIRIWPTTVLLAPDNAAVADLLHVENLKPFPHWTAVGTGKTKCFTLLFSMLPKSVAVFHFAEVIPEPGAFIVENIKRNQQDIYHIDLN